MAENNKDLAAQVEDLRNLVKAQQDRINTLEAANAPDKVNVPQVPSVPKETFTVSGKKYKLTVAKFIDENGNKVLASDALKQPATLERLVLLKSGVIAEVK